MKVVIQRVKHASVTIENNVVGKINKGFMILIGIGEEDTKEEADYIIKKICNLRVFEDENGKMNLSLKDVDGEILMISQFTLYADCTSGNRPSFIKSAKPDKAIPLYEYVINGCRKNGFKVETGKFGADMKVDLLNDGPVTIIIEK